MYNYVDPHHISYIVMLYGFCLQTVGEIIVPLYKLIYNIACTYVSYCKYITNIHINAYNITNSTRYKLHYKFHMR